MLFDILIDFDWSLFPLNIQGAQSLYIEQYTLIKPVLDAHNIYY